MKIVTYNVNGLRPRISQFGSLLKLLDSFQADIICFQETKVRRQELTSDLVMADGYESFFSCTATSDRGRLGYSGVATFCRVKSAFSSSEVALPVSAEEGLTRLLENAHTRKDESPKMMEGLEDFAMDELCKVDREGRCIITDHGHFVLFNIYGPRAECDDTERIQFKSKFYKILQKRWEILRRKGRRVFIVGDFNIAPSAIDRCDAGPDFEKNEFRRWFRSILVESGGPFYDVFRAKHPERREAYTCWSQSTGAEEFNYGSRIDHILSAGSCLHEEHNLQGKNLVSCHVDECDILMDYNRWKPGSTPRWKGGRSIKLEGSDHAPVYMSLVDIPDVPPHSTPYLSTRYLPGIHGLQQTIVSILMKRNNAEPVTTLEVASSLQENNLTGCSSDCKKRTFNTVGLSSVYSCEAFSSAKSKFEGAVSEIEEQSTSSAGEATLVNNHVRSMSCTETKKKARKRLASQLSLRSYFQKPQNLTDPSVNQADVSISIHHPAETAMVDDETISSKQPELKSSASTQNQEQQNSVGSLVREKNNVALHEWQRIQQLMQNSIPLCKGHSEPCVARVVKKPGPNFGRRFYVCARAEGPTSNSEANCGYFKWAASKARKT